MSTLEPLGLLPVVTCLLVAYQLRPSGEAFAPVRLALVRAAVLVGAGAAVLVEALSLFRALTTAAMAVSWSVAALAALGGAIRRYRAERHRPRPLAALRRYWRAAGWPERIMGITVAGLVAGELVIAFVSPPNNFDSQTYHLPKIEHWVVQRDVTFYPTAIHRQVSMAPGAEYLLLHLRLLTGGDTLYNLLQLAAGVGCALLVSRIAGQLGGSARAQLLAAFVVATTPIVALESTSTQTDLVVAAWVGAVATLVLDGLARRATRGALVLLGAATGLTVLTKATGMLAAAPLLLVWLIAQLRRSVPRALAGGLLVGLLALVVAGPYLNRLDSVYGNPLGPPELRTSISMQRHDPPSVLVNALRIGQTALQTPLGPLGDVTATGIERLSRAMGVDPNDQRITFTGSTFPSLAWPPDEDRASFPVEGALVLLGAGFLVVRQGPRVPRAGTGLVRVYAAVFWLSLLCYVAEVKWQPWGNRLILFVLVLGAPLAGLWLDAVLGRRSAGPPVAPELVALELVALEPIPVGASTSAAGGNSAATVSPALLARSTPGGDAVPVPVPVPARVRPARRIVAGLAAVALLVSGCAGWLAVGYGWPRRLVGPGSVFTVSDLHARFQRRPQWQADYEWAAAAVRASGARRVGLVQGFDTWEYPWWVLLRGDDIEALQSLEPGIPPVAPDTVDAILCVSSSHLCQAYLPQGWTMRMRDGIGYALAPR